MSVDFREILTQEDPEPQWVVREFLARGVAVILAGEAGVGKSILSYTLAMSVATGLPFLGYPVEQTRVLYIDEENSRPDFRQYARWVWRGLNCPSIEQVNDQLKVEHLTIKTTWFDTVKRAAVTYKPGLIIIDTATTVLQLEDENDNAEATRATRELRAITESTENNTALVILKHARVVEEPGQKTRRTVRGAKAWLGNVDGVWYQYADGAGRPRKDGLRPTVLQPDKFRAHGLRQVLQINPTWTTEKPPHGLILRAAAKIVSH